MQTVVECVSCFNLFALSLACAPFLFAFYSQCYETFLNAIMLTCRCYVMVLLVIIVITYLWLVILTNALPISRRCGRYVLVVLDDLSIPTSTAKGKHKNLWEIPRPARFLRRYQLTLKVSGLTCLVALVAIIEQAVVATKHSISTVVPQTVQTHTWIPIL